MTTVEVPSLERLHALRAEGMQVGYKGIYIYLRYRAILEVLASIRFDRVLEVGCGYGIFARLLPPDIDYVGVDTGEAEVRVASAWAAAHRPGWRLLRETVTAHAPADAAFDLVLLSEVLEHMPEPDAEATLAASVRALAPGGHLLVTVPNRLHVRNRARRLATSRELVLMDPTHLREYTLGEARRLVDAFPLTPVAFRGAVLYFPKETVVARVIRPESRLRTAALAAFPALASHFVFLLRKPA